MIGRCSPPYRARIGDGAASWQERQRGYVEGFDGMEVAMIQCGDRGRFEALRKGDY
ncbi:hypothetical protein GCM10022420_047770 [Streptomyces iranensis]